MNKLSKAQERFIDKLLKSLENDKIPWRATWDTYIAKPYNELSNQEYKGVNQLNLMMTANMSGFDDPRWLTFKQAQSQGYRIKAGSKGTDIYHFTLRHKENKSTISFKEYAKLTKDEQKLYYIATKSYVVFNAKQIDGMPKLDMTKKEVHFSNAQAVEFTDVLTKNMGVTLEHKGVKAFYLPAQDKIVLPDKERFMDEQAYYATRLHETAHATSNPKRLNRNVSTKFASEDYAIEELRAELTSALLTLDVGFHFDANHEANHRAYIQAWVQAIKSNPKIIFDAIKDAQGIRAYMLEKGEYNRIYAIQETKEVVNAIEEPIRADTATKAVDEVNTSTAQSVAENKAEGAEHKGKIQKITLEQLKDSINIAEYARDVLGFHIIKESRGLMRLEEHDSCKIYPNNTYYRYSRGVGGSIIDFIKHFEECDIKEAIHKMQEYYESYHPEIIVNGTSRKMKREIKGIELPEKGATNKHVYAYLTKNRCIKPSIVRDYINRKILYEDVNHNCVFVGKFDDTIQFAHIKGTRGRQFRMDAIGSIKEIGVYIDNGSDTLVVNEAVIDQMSYMSMCDNPSAYNYLAVAGAGVAIGTVRFHLVKRGDDVKRIIIGLDNDAAGTENTEKLLDWLKSNYPEIETMVHIPDAKDFNEQLQNEMELLAQTAPISKSAEPQCSM